MTAAILGARSRDVVLVLTFVIFGCGGDAASVNAGADPGAGAGGAESGSGAGTPGSLFGGHGGGNGTVALADSGHVADGSVVPHADGAVPTTDGGGAAGDAAQVMGGTDAAVDAGHDAGPPPLSGTCEPCTVDADCESPAYKCIARSQDGYALMCFPAKDADGGNFCNAWPGGDKLQFSSIYMVCQPHAQTGPASSGPISCAEWHMLTGL